MKKLISIALTLILLISNVGFTMATHFCGGEAVKSELMLGQKQLGCDMPDMERHGESDSTTRFDAKGCCDNHYQALTIEDDYSLKLVKTLNFDFAIAFVHVFLKSDIPAEFEKQQYAHYSPPLLLRDLPVLNQVFLI